ncbi:hypothetical protein ONZ45_g12109 [Pleurotus djamor]|nr:hypothetical protein ONZ45_g12109 [Pleurotus djamor]
MAGYDTRCVDMLHIMPIATLMKLVPVQLFEQRPFLGNASLEEQIKRLHKINTCITQRITDLYETMAQAEEARKKKIAAAQKTLVAAETKLKESQKRKAEVLATEKEQEAEVKRLRKAFEAEVQSNQLAGVNAQDGCSHQ